MADALLELTGVSVEVLMPGARFRLKGPRPRLPILEDIDVRVPARGAAGIVGESGAGKTTLMRAIVGLQELSAGAVAYDGMPLSPKRTLEQRRRIQMVFQDPFSSLNPRMSVEQTLAELLRLHRVVPRAEIAQECRRLVELVGLPSSALTRRPAGFSGGQRQRIAIARALAPRPTILLADEPVSSLDVSVQATILRLLKDLQLRLGLTIVFISHDLAVVRQFCDYVFVMKDGRVVDRGSAAGLFARPEHPYTRELFTAVPPLTAGAST